MRVASLLIFICLFTSCEHIQKLVDSKTTDGIDKKELPKWSISVNQVIRYPRATPGEKEVPSYNGGENVWVRKHFEFNSKVITLIEAIPSKEKDKFDLKLKLDRHGAMIAMRLCNESQQSPWGLLIDGIYYGKVNIEKATQKEDDYSEIVLKGALDKATAGIIEKYSMANYEHFHKDDK